METVTNICSNRQRVALGLEQPADFRPYRLPLAAAGRAGSDVATERWPFNQLEPPNLDQLKELQQSIEPK